MFLDKNKQTSALQIYEEGTLLPVLSADGLVTSRRYRFILDELAQASLLPENHFELLYTSLIDRFAEFVQLLPRQFNGALGGLLNEGIVRGMTAIVRYNQQFGSDSLDALNCYALFSAALLLDVSKAVTNQQVIITNDQGEYVTQWRPFVGPMTGLGKYYKLYPLSSAYSRLDISITAILARQIMPESGFLWISSHWRIFADWLDALHGGRRGGRLAHLISRILEEDLQELLRQIKGFNIDPFAIPGEGYGDDFLKWLKEGIADGSIDINGADSMVHAIEEGVFVDKQLFKQYADIINLPVSINVVFTQFGNMTGIVNRGGDYDFQFKQYFSDVKSERKPIGFTSGIAARQASHRSGMVVKDAGLVFQGKDLPTMSTHVKSVTRIDAGKPEILQNPYVNMSNRSSS